MPYFSSYLWGKYFSTKIHTVLHQSKKELSDWDQNWAKTEPLLFKTFEISNAMDSHMRNVQCGSSESLEKDKKEEEFEKYISRISRERLNKGLMGGVYISHISREWLNRGLSRELHFSN